MEVSFFFFFFSLLCVNKNYLSTSKLGLFHLFLLILPHNRKDIQTSVLNLANRNRGERETTTIPHFFLSHISLFLS